jgi:AbrB family looped-hinge helix DNA binding protein
MSVFGVMTVHMATISDRGQVTLPAEIRRESGVHSGTKVQVEFRGGEIVLRPVLSLDELYGSLAEYAKGEYVPYDVARDIALEREAAEIAREGLK